MPRAFWKGAISFGMVIIPVRMYTATETRTPSFHLLHKKCLTRPKQLLHCETDDEYFTAKETVRGYEYAKGQFVVMTDQDLEKVPVRTLHTIDILGFVREAEIDPIYYHGSHYIEPEEIGVRPFHLLRQVLVESGRVGVAKVAFQRREHLVCLRPSGNDLVLHTMHYADEILARPEAPAPEKEPASAEIEMARMLVEAMTREFDAADYVDDYADALRGIVDAKVKGEEIKAVEPVRIDIPDLMAALRASVEAAREESAARG
jgi:DNA end-binding protein Ku